MVKWIEAQLIVPSASVEEAAAIIAAVERFEREKAPRADAGGEPCGHWARAAILENVVRDQDDAPDPWINT